MHAYMWTFIFIYIVFLYIYVYTYTCISYLHTYLYVGFKGQYSPPLRVPLGRLQERSIVIR